MTATTAPADLTGPTSTALAGIVPAGRTTGVFGTVMAVASRTVKQFVRTPQLIVVGTVQGAMFLLIFRYVFGGAITPGPVSYVDSLVPGFVTTSVLFAGMST